MLPLYLLTSAKGQPILVELKNGETLNGKLVICDSWMNLTLSDVIQSSANGESFLKIPEIYVRGNHIKYLRLPDEVMDKARLQAIENQKYSSSNRRDNRGGNRYGGGNRNYNNNSNNNRNNYGGNNRGYRNYHNNNQQQQQHHHQHQQQQQQSQQGQNFLQQQSQPQEAQL